MLKIVFFRPRRAAAHGLGSQAPSGWRLSQCPSVGRNSAFTNWDVKNFQTHVNILSIVKKISAKLICRIFFEPLIVRRYLLQYFFWCMFKRWQNYRMALMCRRFLIEQWGFLLFFPTKNPELCEITRPAATVSFAGCFPSTIFPTYFLGLCCLQGYLSISQKCSCWPKIPLSK